MRTVVVLLCGIPGCGKSTLASHLIDALASPPTSAAAAVTTGQMIPPHIISAAAHSNLGGRGLPVSRSIDVHVLAFDDVARKEVLKDSRSAGLALLDALLTNASNAPSTSARVIIVDDVMEYGSMRREVYARARDANADYIVVWCRCDRTIAVQRDAGRSGTTQIGAVVIDRIANRFEPLNPKDIWDRNFIEIDTSDASSFPRHVALLESTILSICAGKEDRYKLCPIASEPDATQVVATVSPVHDLDNELRKIISEVIKNVRMQDYKARLGSLLSSAKRRVLSTFPPPRVDNCTIEVVPKELLCEAMRHVLAESNDKTDTDLVDSVIKILEEV